MYIIQGMFDDSSIVFEENFQDCIECPVEEIAEAHKAAVIKKAKNYLASPWCEGIWVRVITDDGELVWDSKDKETADAH